MEKPKPPPNRWISEDVVEQCLICGSSRRKTLLFFTSKKCIQPNCVNYYKGFPNADIDHNSAVYLKIGKCENYANL
jgi:hypothetical protein